MRRPRRNHSAAFKARVALEALRGEKTLTELVAHNDVQANQIATLKNELLSRGAEIFGGSSADSGNSTGKERELHEKIGTSGVKSCNRASVRHHGSLLD